jgi:hypothetical protein
MFYNSNNNTFFDINSGSIDITLYSSQNQPIVNLFTLNMMQRNMQLTKEAEDGENRAKRVIEDNKDLRKYSRDQVILISFSKSSEYFPEITPNLLNDIISLVSTNTGMYLRTKIEFRVN